MSSLNCPDSHLIPLLAPLLPSLLPLLTLFLLHLPLALAMTQYALRQLWNLDHHFVGLLAHQHGYFTFKQVAEAIQSCLVELSFLHMYPSPMAK